MKSTFVFDVCPLKVGQETGQLLQRPVSGASCLLAVWSSDLCFVKETQT